MDRPGTNQELYGLVDTIASRLTAAGQPEWANRVRFAVESGATSGEIFTNLGKELSELIISGIPKTTGVQAEVDIALDVIDEALRRVGQIPPSRPAS